LSKIVNGGKSDKHIIKTYKFKELDDLAGNDDEFVSSSFAKLPEKETQEDNVISQSEPSSGVNSEIVENLLLKIEELSTNMLKAQSEFENEIKKCYDKLQAEKTKSFEEGYQKGLQEARDKCQQEINETKKLFEDSIKKLDEISKIFEEKIDTIEKELISVALDIAKEILQKEISENSQEIAYNLAKSLMEDVKNATHVKIKVNPKDAEFLKDKFKGVEIIPDEAVKEGGVVILSDVGNIDGEIEERFKAVKEAVLKARSS